MWNSSTCFFHKGKVKLKYLFFFNSFSFTLEKELKKNKYLSVFMLVQKLENYVNVDARFEISDNDVII